VFQNSALVLGLTNLVRALVNQKSRLFSACNLILIQGALLASLAASISEALPLFGRKLFGASIAALQLPAPPKFAASSRISSTSRSCSSTIPEC
jgi:hypothetical protein